MTFRPPISRRWLYPFILCACATIAYIVVHAARRMSPESLGYAGLLVLTGTVLCLMFSWEVWTSRVTLDDEGVSWQLGHQEGRLPWEQISSLSQDGIVLSLVERSSTRTIPLPFVTRRPYLALTKRVPPLKREEERILFSDTGLWD